MWYGFKMVGNFCKKILKAHMLKRAQLESKNSLRGGLEPVQKLFKVFMLLWSYVMEKLIISCFDPIFGPFVDIFGPLRDPQISYFCGNMNYLYLEQYPNVVYYLKLFHDINAHILAIYHQFTVQFMCILANFHTKIQ